MSERLIELQRQRALIQGHLAWLDKEIAAIPTESSPAAPQSPTRFQSAPEAPVQPAAYREADELIAQFTADPKGLAQSARKGCFLFFGLALAIFALGVYGLYRYSRSRHEHAGLPDEKAAHGSPSNR